MKQFLARRLRNMLGCKPVQIITNGVSATVDPSAIDEALWSKRVHSGKLIGHDRESVQTAIVGDSIILKSPSGEDFLALEVDGFEATAFMFLLQRG
jgi:hypothetical protein